jgi:hypothetical protein
VVQENRKLGILGIGLDNDDGHVRLTRGKNFRLIGGSQDTHQQMQEKCIKLNEKLDTRGKKLEQLEKQELTDLAAECDMKITHWAADAAPSQGDRH